MTDNHGIGGAIGNTVQHRTRATSYSNTSPQFKHISNGFVGQAQPTDDEMKRIADRSADESRCGVVVRSSLASIDGDACQAERCEVAVEREDVVRLVVASEHCSEVIDKGDRLIVILDKRSPCS